MRTSPSYRTNWFPPEVKPVHIGMYEIRNRDGFGIEWWAYWNGEKWVFLRHPDWVLMDQDREWRGLKRKQKIGASHVQDA